MTIELHNCDCLDFMRTMPDKSVDAVITDPPYGVGRDKGFEGFGGFGTPIARIQYTGNWDDKRPNKVYFDEILRIGKLELIFGGNYFSDFLPVGTHWVVWDKKQTMPTFGDCELVWTNSPRKSVKWIEREWNGLLGKEEARQHATQKPTKIIKWLIENYTSEGDTIFDPFMGSGTTGVACVQTGRNFIGCEIDEGYFKIAEKRIHDAQQQSRLAI
jgi:site-specific DNA-methyltransferase (adenine-specific)